MVIYMISVHKYITLKRLMFDSFVFLDYDECDENTNQCDANAYCVNTVGSYTCQCQSGFSGDGRVCTGIF